MHFGPFGNGVAADDFLVDMRNGVGLLVCQGQKRVPVPLERIEAAGLQFQVPVLPGFAKIHEILFHSHPPGNVFPRWALSLLRAGRGGVLSGGPDKPPYPFYALLRPVCRLARLLSETGREAPAYALCRRHTMGRDGDGNGCTSSRQAGDGALPDDHGDPGGQGICDG